MVSSNNETKYASAASCNAKIDDDEKRKSFLNVAEISRTKRWNGNLRINKSVDFWYCLISRTATVPGR